MDRIILQHQNEYTIDLSAPIDISIPIRASTTNVNAWYIPPPVITPVTEGNWIGKVSEGASTNFNNIIFNPHGHGTHTECVGHITEEFHSINRSLQRFFFIAQLISVTPEEKEGDKVITKAMIASKLTSSVEAVILRTLPNTEDKLSRQYSHTNWAYLSEEAATFLRESGVNHLLIDLPSVDKEKDDGKLLAHKAFWRYPQQPRYNATITEMIYVPEHITDDRYLLNLQIAAFDNDASPSKPILYRLHSPPIPDSK
ncbi:cyclase family protein [Aquimarina hainanensis]|uniref:Cyclase family protein n=1 Tax=Aquimarina hainanensis TaxID=1578017 RepID=A0ABW5N242_9FLAO|nr:cyclase family protein [Aquimarina sp. TRL1]QKX04323.1 cyclase family protein [Aquimarina sp. TRL1]